MARTSAGKIALLRRGHESGTHRAPTAQNVAPGHGNGQIRAPGADFLAPGNGYTRNRGLIWRMALPCKLSLPFLFGIIRQKFPDDLRCKVFVSVVRD